MRLKFLISFFLLTGYCFSQPYGNSWIDFSKSYYKFEISVEGIYKINRTALLSAGIPITSINPKNIQIFERGKEIPIYIKGEEDGIFDVTDYIELYGRKNDSWMDSLLYDKPEDVMNPYTSILTDVNTYYLTWNNSTNNLRFKEETDEDFSSYSKLDYFWFTSTKEYFNTSAKGYTYGPEYAYKGNAAGFQRGEGFIEGTLLASGKSYIKPISTHNAYTSGPNGEMAISQVFISDAELNSGNFNHHIKIEYTGLTFDTLFKGFTLLKRTLPLKTAEILSPNTPIKFTAVNDLDIKGGVDYSSLSYISITYPHAFDMSNDKGKIVNSFFKMKIPDNPKSTKSTIELTNFYGRKGDVLLYDLDNHKRISFQTITDSSGIYRGVLPNSGKDKNCVVIAERIIRAVPKLTKVEGTGKFTNYTSVKDYNYIIITHKSLLTAAQNYQTYRNSTGFNTLLVDIENIYDQFGYGIAKNPLAIRYFMDFALDKWNVKPEHLLLIGKSVSVDDKLTAYGKSFNLVPTFGVPGSDQMLLAGLNNTKFESPVSIGRISAINPSQVEAYLNKVKDFESAKTAEWMKNSLFFSGGNNPDEQESFRENIEEYATVFKQAPFGGTFFMKSKTSSAPFETSLQDSVRSIINNGATMLTLFGHSGGGIATTGSFGTFDISIDRVEEWNNKGKYPFMIANSCYSGNLHGGRAATVSSSESYVLTPNKGVIGYYAHAGAGYPYPLHVITKELFDNISINNYGQPIGKIIQNSIKNLQQIETSEFYRSLFFNEQYHGDPAIILNAHTKPDFEVTPASIFFTPATVTTELSEFKINIIVTNIGRATNDSIDIILSHKFPNNQKPDTFYLTRIPPVFYKDTVSFLITTDILNAVGVNEFEVTLDPENTIDELDETKNTAKATLFIKSGVVFPISPYEYSVIPNNQVILKAVTNDPFLKEQKYILQLDTNGNFNSPFLKTNKLSQAGGVIEWKVPFNLVEKQVYFWRISPDSSDQKIKYVWKSSSFQYIEGKSGWGQSHFHQFIKDKLTFLTPVESNRTFKFDDTGKNYHSFSHASPGANDYPKIGFDIDGCCGEKTKCNTSAKILVAIIDPITLEPLSAWDTKHKKGYRFGQVTTQNTCRGRPERYFQYNIPPTKGVEITPVILDSLLKRVPKGYYIGIFNWGPVSWHNWSQETKDYFTKELNSKAFTKNPLDTTKYYLSNKQSFGFFTQIGNPKKTSEVFATGSNVDFNVRMENSFIFGEITSVKIGPSLGWESAEWEYSLVEADTSNIDVIGESEDGNETYLFSNETSQKGNVNLTTVDRKLYPNIRLNYYTKDSIKYDPAKLKEWYVFLKGIGDAAINPIKHFSISADTIGEGDPVRISVAIENVSLYDMDSMLVSYYVEDANRIIHKFPLLKYKSLKAGDTLIATFNIPTEGLLGLNKVWVEINPNNNQPEKYRFNNFGTIDFYVTTDKANPILDATFDGKHILNGDIVSPTPEIVIKITDDHKFLALDDTSLVTIFLTNPAGQKKPIRFDNNSKDYTIEWIPAKLPDNSFMIKYNPKFTQDGKYTLSIQAKDKSNNYSGAREYSISFEVINKSSITKILNWPNPFTTNTRFVFELTGANIPTELKIQIMNISGLVVKEITKEEIGDIKIGRNITEYAWNGTDEFGDKLANGVYFYNVIAKFNGKTIDNRDSNADQFFHKGFGKMYLMR